MTTTTHLGTPPVAGARLSETDLTAIRRIARAAAEERGEAINTVHLLAAVADLDGPARALLEERRVDRARALSAAGTFADDPGPDAIEAALGSAREIARRASVPSREAFPSKRGDCRPAAQEPPAAIHVLCALLMNRRFAAHRALSELGTDIARLRAAATRIALGVVTPPRKRVREGELTQTVQPVAAPPPPPAPVEVEAEPPPVARDKPRRPPSRTPNRAVEVPLLPPIAPALHKAHRGRDGARRAPASKRSVDALDPSECPLLVSLGKNLTRAVRAGELEPVVGREEEIDQALDVLAKRHASSPVFTGPAGVGKTSVARALAGKLGEAGKLLVELPVAELLAGTGARGALSERITDIRAEVKSTGGRVVLFVDELHELLDAGDEAVAELKTAMSAGELQLVGATSTAAFRRIVETDSALARRFTEVPVDEPGEADAFLLLRKVADGLAQHHRVAFSDEAIAVSVSWSIRYLPGRALPDKAVGLLDLAGARRRRRNADASVEPRVEPDHIAEVVSELAAVPVERLLQSDRDRMLDLERLLGERVIGHADACARIAAVLRRNAAGLRAARPIGTFLLLGPTGVGKTETAKAIAEVLFGAPDALTRLDMSEYAEGHAVARLVGAPPGYVGHESGGLLTESVRRRPYQVMLLDEIEKAHRDVLQTFLQVFDEGRLTDGRGRTADFTNTVIVLTSNLGADEMRGAMNEKRVGFGGASRAPRDGAQLRDVAVNAARAILPPELYNRLDEVLFFRPLERTDVRAIAQKLLAGLAAALGARGVKLEIVPAALDALLDAGGGYDPELGARPMRRAISRLVEAPIADMLLRGDLATGATALLTARDGTVLIRPR